MFLFLPLSCSVLFYPLPSHAFHEWRQAASLAAARMRQQLFLGCPPSLLKGRYRVSNSSSWLDTLAISGQGQRSKQVNQLVFVSNETLRQWRQHLRTRVCSALFRPQMAQTSGLRPLPGVASLSPVLQESEAETTSPEIQPNELIQQGSVIEEKSNNVIHNLHGALVCSARQDSHF